MGIRTTRRPAAPKRKKRRGISVVKKGKVVNSRARLKKQKKPLRGVTVIRNGRPYNSRVGYLDK